MKKESEFHWYKEDTEIIPDVKPDLGSGVCKLPIKLVIALADLLNAINQCTIPLLCTCQDVV